MVQELSAASEEAQATLAAIPAAGWKATGVHMDWGEVALPQIVQRVLTGHLAAHCAQAKAAYKRRTAELRAPPAGARA